MSFLTSPSTLANLAHVTPRPTQTLWNDNYLSFDSASGGGTFAAQFLPEIYEKEVERYGKRTISGFLGMVGAEMPLASDQVIWSEQGRIHTAYENVTIIQANNAGGGLSTSAGNGGHIGGLPTGHLLNIGDSVIFAAPDTSRILKCYVIAVGTNDAVIQPYTQQCLNNDGGGAVNFLDNDDANRLFVYGTEFAKGVEMSSTYKSKDASFTQFSNRPVIIRDQYSVNGSDTAQIGWVEVTSENGASGYLWYIKSEAEARLRFNDYLEMVVIEGEEAGSQLTGININGTQGLFAALQERGLVYNQPDFDPAGGGGLSEFDEILQELDKQGGIEENMMFLDRTTSLEIDNMLAAQNSYGSGGTSYGVFNQSEDMALNLGFSGFRRGSYDFYKTDWKYLNDSVTRGGFTDIEGVIVPAGTSTVYDESMGKNISRPFLHVRYRASEADDRKMKSWITGSVGGNYTSTLDKMQVNFLSERCLCVQAANNFVLLKNNADVA
tara:strand:+ start:4042 stop:5523 length:1482 start_codon:yes stop_codon:yes gene_type:complete